MKGTLFFCSIIALASSKPGGFYHQEYNYKSSSSSFKNNELQHQNEDQGFYSKDGDLEGRMKPKVNSHNQHSEYTNPKLLRGESVDLGNGYTGSSVGQGSLDRLFGSNMNGYRTAGAADGFTTAERVMDLSNAYSSGSHGSSHGSYGTSMTYGGHAGGYDTNSLGYGSSSGGYGTNSAGYSSTSNGYGSQFGGHGRTHDSIDISNGGNYGNSLGSSSNYGYTQGGRTYGYVQHGSSSSGYRSSNANLNSMVQRLQDEMSRQLQNAVNNQYRSSGYTTSVSSSQMTADIRALEDELKRNLTRQLEENLRSQYGQQELRGTDYYSVVPGRHSTVANYRNQELADLTGQLENNLLKQLHQNIKTTYNRESGSTYTSTNNLYRPTQFSSSTYRPSHYERTPVLIPSNVRYTPISNPDSITQIASKIQSDINLYLDDALQNIYSTYIQNGRNSYTLSDFDNEVNRIRDQIMRNLTWNLDDQIRRNYGQQILKDDHYYSISSSGQTSTLHNYNVKDYENLKKQVENNLLKKLNQTVNTYRDQYQRQQQQSYTTNANYYTVTFRPMYYTSGNQVYDYSDLQRQLSEQLQNALNQHKYSQSSSYSMSTHSNPQDYQNSLNELTRELQRNLTEQLNNYRVQSSSSSYGYSSGSSVGGGSADFESMKNQLQNQLMQQLQQGLQKQYRYSASASYSASSSSSSNANYGTHQSYGNMYPSHRYKRDTSYYIPPAHHFSYNSAKSSRSYSSSSKFSSQEENFLHRTHGLQIPEYGNSMNFHRTSGGHYGSSIDSDERSPEVVEDVTNHHQEGRPQKIFMMGYHQGTIGEPQHNWRNYHHTPESHHTFDEELRGVPHHAQFPEQDLQHLNGNSDSYLTQQLQAADSHFKFTQNHKLPEQQSQEDLDQKLEIKHPEQLHTGDFQKQLEFTSNHQFSEQQSQEELEQNSKFKHSQQLETDNFQKHLKFTPNHQLPEQQSQEDLHQTLELQHPGQIQTDDSQKQLELQSVDQLQEPQTQEDLDQKLELHHPRIPNQSTYHHQPDQQMENQEHLTQQLEEEPQQKINKPNFASVDQQQIEHHDSQTPEDLEQQQVDDQNELAENLEQQQLEKDHIPKLHREHHSEKPLNERTRNIDQNQDDLTQQLEEEPKYPEQTDNQPIEDLPSHHISSNQPSQEQDDLTQQQIQEDFRQQTTNDRIPKSEAENNQEQELEQQLETHGKNLIHHGKLNQQPEQEFENQNDLTEGQELEQQLETESKNVVPSQKLNQHTNQQELEDQNDLTQQLQVESKQEKTHFTESDSTQQLELGRKPEKPKHNLIPEHHLHGEPNLLTKPKNKLNYDQTQVEQSEDDMTQQLLLSNKPNPKNTQEQELTGQVEDDLNQKLEQQQTSQEIQQQDNTQQEIEQPLEQVDQKIEQKHEAQTEDDESQTLELTNSNKHPSVGQLESDLDQKLELTHSKKHDELDQQVQEQQDLKSIPNSGTHVQDQQTEDQSVENHLSQQLESDNIPTHKKPDYSHNVNQEIENNNEQQLEITDVHTPQKPVGNIEQQTQLKVTKTENGDQKGQTDHPIYGFPQHTLNQLTNPITATYQRPELHVNTYQHTSSSERAFTNGHTGYSTDKTIDKKYEEALRQQDALLNLLKQKIHEQTDKPTLNEQKIIKKTTYVNENPLSTFESTHYTKANGEIKNTENTFFNGNTIPENELSRLNGIYRHGYAGTTSSKSTRRVVHFVNGKPVSATEYVRIVKPNGQIVESKHEIPLTPDLLRQFSQISSPSQVADTLRSTHHFVGSTENLSPSSENFRSQYQYSQGSSKQHSINMADGMERTGHYGQFSNQLPPSQFTQNAGNDFQVSGLRRSNQFSQIVGDEHDMTSMGDLLRQNEFSHGINQFSHNVDDQLLGSGFSGQASKKTSYYVNGKLVSSSESHQRIGPDGRIIEVETGSHPSAIGNIEQQLAELQGIYSGHNSNEEPQIADSQSNYPGHKTENISRYRVKTSQHTRRIGY